MVPPIRSSCARRGQRRPEVEPLEDRCTPATFTFSNPVIAAANPMAMVSQPAANATSFDEFEAADDFIAPTAVRLDSATFTGLLPTPLANITSVDVEIYRVFPVDSNVGRTSGAATVPPFQTPHVPTRANSPSDVAFESRDSAAGELTFTPAILNPVFTAANSVTAPNGVNPKPGQTTGGNGPQTEQEVKFTVTFTSPIYLPADHYFFVPQVALTGNPAAGFLWLAGTRPNPAQTPDLQAWIRNSNLDPDWLRVGTDIVGGAPAPTFNGAFDLAGVTLVAPTISSISPTSATEGTAASILVVNGADFTNQSQVLFNGMPLATAFLSASQVAAIVPGGLLSHAGNASVMVANPIPGAGLGVSNSLSFLITDPKPTVTATATGSTTSATIRGSFSDAASEAHQITITWGDGTTDILHPGVSASGNFNLTHKYKGKQAFRRHTITVVVTDDEGQTSNTVILFVPGKPVRMPAR
jgi:hypothetical protein